MSPPTTSSPKIVCTRHDNSTPLTLSQTRLQHLTKVAVDRAYKLHTESRRLVHIVETQSCRDSARLGCSNPFFSISSALLRTPPSSSKDWALSKDSSDRCSVAARIHAFLNQWRADASSEWRARVASVVPVLEEVLYKEAKSQEEYTNPQLLESQLMNVLCHFEAGNGPFLLQGSSPLYPVRGCNPPSSSSNGTSPISQHASGRSSSANGDSHEIAPEQTHERVGLTSTANLSLASRPVSTSNWSASDGAIQSKCDAKMCTQKSGGGNHTSSKIVNKVAALLSKKRKEKACDCSKQGLERDNEGAERFIIASEIEACAGRVRVEETNDGMTCDRSPKNACRGNERIRSTLGGMLKLGIDMFSIERSSTAEASHLSPSSTINKTSRKSGAEALDRAYIVDSQFIDAGWQSLLHSSPGQSVHLDQGRRASRECKAVSHFPFASIPSPRSSSASSLASASASSSSSSSSTSSSASSSASSAALASASPPRRSMLCSPSSSSVLSSSSLALPHQAPVRSSSSPPQEHFIPTSIARLKPMPQHQSSSSSRQLACLSASSDVPSVQLDHAWLLTREDSQIEVPSENSRVNMLSEARQGKKQATQIALKQPISETASEEPRKRETGESSSTSMASPPSETNEELLETREKKVKLPLRSFLAEREEQMGCKSSYQKGGPWDTWEEATERLDGMCCVCMVGLKGAAFIPCGHTFCRKCSRELWRGRGTCPLCNRYIREILDIY